MKSATGIDMTPTIDDNWIGNGRQCGSRVNYLLRTDRSDIKGDRVAIGRSTDSTVKIRKSQGNPKPGLNTHLFFSLRRQTLFV